MENHEAVRLEKLETRKKNLVFLVHPNDMSPISIKYDSHVELFRNSYIPEEWDTNCRVSCFKPEYAEVTINRQREDL